MKKFIFILVTLFVVVSCKKETAKKEIVESNKCAVSKKFDMYKSSEMAILMEQMYVENSKLKERILKGATLGAFPSYYTKIFSAKFTDESDNDAFFKDNANLYIAAQKLLYSSSKNYKENFNAGVTACITCHEGKCGGPIPKIKKLYIQ